jgi:transposase-like protein
MTDVLDRHSRMPRKYEPGDQQPKDEVTGQFLAYPQEVKQAVLNDVRPMLLGGANLEKIAAKHGVAISTLNYWLAQLGEEYKEIRKQWLDSKLSDSEARMVEAKDPFQLAKGRELARLAMWYAERRDPERYADKRELTVKTDEPTTPEQVREKISQLEAKLGIRTIEHKPEQQNSEEQKQAA